MATQTQTQTDTAPADTSPPRWWNVVLLNDEEHTYEYVIRMLQNLFAHPQEKARQLAKAVDTQGRAICLTTHTEHAELKRDQILAFGRDHYIASCKGSMTSIIEPALGGGDDDDEHSDKNRKD